MKPGYLGSDEIGVAARSSAETDAEIAHLSRIYQFRTTLNNDENRYPISSLITPLLTALLYLLT